MAAEIAPWRRITAAATAVSVLGGSLPPPAEHPPVRPLAVDRIVLYEAYGPEGTAVSRPQDLSDADLPEVLENAWQELHEGSDDLVPADVSVEAAGSIALTGVGPLSSVCEDKTRHKFFNQVTDKVRNNSNLGSQDLLVVAFTPEPGSKVCDNGGSFRPAGASQYGRDIVIYNRPAIVSREGLSGQESVMHEYGHAVLDLKHNNMVNCKVNGEPGSAIVRVVSACNIDLYGDPYTKMGARPVLKNDHLFHGFEQRRLGMVGADQVASILNDGEHELRLTSLGADNSGLKLARVPLPSQALGELDIPADALYFEFSSAEGDSMGIKAYGVNESALGGGDPEDSHLLSLSADPFRHSLQSAGQSAELLFDDLRLTVAVRSISCIAADIAVSLVQK